jgi:hypothetical protein
MIFTFDMRVARRKSWVYQYLKGFHSEYQDNIHYQVSYLNHKIEKKQYFLFLLDFYIQ